MTFVTALRPEWTISIFHYRNHGADVGRIVVGVLVKNATLKTGTPSCAMWAIPAGKKPGIPPIACFWVNPALAEGPTGDTLKRCL